MKRCVWLALGCSSLLACTLARTPLPPAPPSANAEALAAWREPPPLAADTEPNLQLALEHFELPSGLGVTIVSRPDSAATTLELHVPTARDRSEGAVTVMAEALRAGTRRASGPTLVNPKLGVAPVDIGTDALGTTFRWHVLPRGTERALGLLASFVLTPAFDDAEVKIRLQQALAEVQRNSEAIGQLRGIARAAIPGLERPSPGDDARALFQLDASVLREVHRCVVRPEHAELVVVGPAAPDAVRAWATAAFGGWSAGAKAAPESCSRWLTPELPEHPDQARLDRPDLQIIYGGTFDPWLTLAVPGPAVDSPDFLPFTLLGEILEERHAGSVKALRHEGATYGIHTGTFDRYPHLSLLEIQGQVEPESAQDALRAVVEDLRGLAQHLDPAELDTVKKRWKTRAINALSNDDGVASRILWQLRRGRRVEDLPSVFAEVSQIDVARCHEVAEQWLTPAQPAIAVAGVPAHISRGLNLNVRVHEMAWTDKPQAYKASASRH